MVVVVSEPSPTYNGASITNCAEALATLIVQEFKLRTDKLVWLEHYPITSTGETLDLVYFDWEQIDWVTNLYPNGTQEIALSAVWKWLNPEKGINKAIAYAKHKHTLKSKGFILENPKNWLKKYGEPYALLNQQYKVITTFADIDAVEKFVETIA